MKVVAVLCLLASAVYGGVVVPAPALVRTPQFDSAVIKSERLGGNFAYSHVEAPAYAAVNPVVSHVPTPVGVSYQYTPVQVPVAAAPVRALPAVPAPAVPALPALAAPAYVPAAAPAYVPAAAPAYVAAPAPAYISAAAPAYIPAAAPAYVPAAAPAYVPAAAPAYVPAAAAAPAEESDVVSVESA